MHRLTAGCIWAGRRAGTGRIGAGCRLSLGICLSHRQWPSSSRVLQIISPVGLTMGAWSFPCGPRWACRMLGVSEVSEATSFWREADVAKARAAVEVWLCRSAFVADRSGRARECLEAMTGVQWERQHWPVFARSSVASMTAVWRSDGLAARTGVPERKSRSPSASTDLACCWAPSSLLPPSSRDPSPDIASSLRQRTSLSHTHLSPVRPNLASPAAQQFSGAQPLPRRQPSTRLLPTHRGSCRRVSKISSSTTMKRRHVRSVWRSLTSQTRGSALVLAATRYVMPSRQSIAADHPDLCPADMPVLLQQCQE